MSEDVLRTTDTRIPARWQSRAACRGMDNAVFFHPDNERGASRRRRESNAKRICAGCPVTTECLTAALSFGEVFGIWGGRSAGERGHLTTALDDHPARLDQAS